MRPSSRGSGRSSSRGRAGGRGGGRGRSGGGGRGAGRGERGGGRGFGRGEKGAGRMPELRSLASGGVEASGKARYVSKAAPRKRKLGKSSLDVVVIPLYWKERPEEMERVLSRSHGLVKALRAAGIKAVADVDTVMMPGAKFRHWEERRVKLRVEVGPKEVARRAAVLAVVTEPGSVAARSEHLGKEALVEAALEALKKLRRRVKPRKASGGGGEEGQESADEDLESAEDEQEGDENGREGDEDEQENAEREVEVGGESDSDFGDEAADVDSEREVRDSEEEGPAQKPVKQPVERKAKARDVAATTAGTATRVAASAPAGPGSKRKLDPKFTKSGDDLDDDFDQLAGSSDEEDKAAEVAPKPAAKKRGPPKEVIF